MIRLDPETTRLRERLGKGARYDADAAPAKELAWARLGTAYFARKLNELDDGELDAPTMIVGWSRRRLIGHVGHQARALSRIVEAARTGQPWQDASGEEREAEMNSATLPARALRHLFYHSEVHLNVEWRDLKDADWEASVTVEGKSVAIRDTPLIRARAVWVHAVDLLNRGAFQDFPPEFLGWLAARCGARRMDGSTLAETVRLACGRAVDAGNHQHADLAARPFGATEV